MTSASAIPLRPGTELADFSLPDVRGHEVNLSEVLTRSRALIVFYRGGWCPLCNAQLGKLTTAYPEFEARGVQIIAISNEEVEQGAEILKKIGPPYHLLLDGEGVLLERLGLVVGKRDLWSKVRRKHDFAHPASILVGQDHRIQWSYKGRNYRDRPSVKLLLGAIDGQSSTAAS